MRRQARCVCELGEAGQPSARTPGLVSWLACDLLGGSTLALGFITDRKSLI